MTTDTSVQNQKQIFNQTVEADCKQGRKQNNVGGSLPHSMVFALSLLVGILILSFLLIRSISIRLILFIRSLLVCSLK